MKIGRVYKIRTADGPEFYIGSTFNSLESRMRQHIADYRSYSNNKKKDNMSVWSIFDKYGVDSCSIFLIREYEVFDYKQLNALEQLWINKLSPVNYNSAFSIYYISYRSYLKKMNEKARERRKNFKAIEQWRKDRFDDMFQSANENGELEEIEGNRVKIKCFCGSKILKEKFRDHCWSNRHYNFLANFVEPTK
jgi:hypothetical protein